MRHYETIYILNPNLSDEEYHEIIDKFNKLIETQKGVIIKRQEWGKQRLAYAINKFNNGFYVLVGFCANPGVTAELERNCKIDDRILKYQTIKIADNADPQELLLKEKEAQKEIKEIAVDKEQDMYQEYGFQEDEKPVEDVEDSEVENGE
jgi:small subunit ribosomal protein S6